MKIYKSLFALLILCLMPLTLLAHPTLSPKREFRGAWIQAVNGQFMGMKEGEMKPYLTTMLDELQKANVNAIIFQVRVEGDALYPSKYEPWSRYLTGKQGVSPGWDPLAFMIAESHKRNMELHAWINPYRARTKGTREVAPNHKSQLTPANFIEYDNQLYFNPAQQENRDYICTIVKDILSRYDVDGLHIDDYFYPYPTKGKEFPDDSYYEASSGFSGKGDWRRDNVNRLIKQLHETVRSVKPWLKFGVSPFGIYRNATADFPGGSATNGLQSYNDLYADVLLWINKGWVDYCIPQVYWEIGHKAADYEALVEWWAANAGHRPLFIGQDVNRTVRAADTNNSKRHQQPRKYDLQRAQKNIQGSCLWDAASAANNVGRYRDVLTQYYHRYPALMPKMSFIDKKAPKKVTGIRAIDTADGQMLVWLKPKDKKNDPMNSPWRYVVYCFNKKEKVNLDDTSKIVSITPDTFYRIPANASKGFTYVVTVLDRLQNESKGKKCKIK